MYILKKKKEKEKKNTEDEISLKYTQKISWIKIKDNILAGINQRHKQYKHKVNSFLE